MTESLWELTNQELLYKQLKKVYRVLIKARFPMKRMSDFKLGYQSNINKKHILDIQHLNLRIGKKSFFIGSSGVGQSHLATSVGAGAREIGHSNLVN